MNLWPKNQSKKICKIKGGGQEIRSCNVATSDDAA